MTTDQGDTGHVSAERLAAAALWALEDDRPASAPGTGEPGTGTGDDAVGRPEPWLALLSTAERAHVDRCAVCRYELDAVLQVAALSDRGDLTLQGLQQPDPALWTRIAEAIDQPAGLTPAAQVGAPPSAAVASPSSPDGQPVSPDGRPVTPERPARRRRGRVLVALVAAVVGLLVGVGATVAVRRASAPASQVVASTPLQALPGEQGSGTAELIRSGGVLDLRVRVNASTIPDRFFQLWLLDSADGRMYDLGTLPPSGATATYPLPAELARGLGSYTTVDVSIEPYDGNPAHSHHSLVRGQLPN